MPVFGYGEIENYDSRWRLLSEFKALGHIITPSGSINACFSATMKAAWRQFWANIGRPTFKAFTVRLRLKRLESLVFSVINFCESRWPFSLTKAKSLDRVQRKMVGIIVNISVHPEESRESFWRRKNTLISSFIPKHRRWSAIWAKRSVCWHEHVQGQCRSSLVP